jgi:hypothetical protein
LHLSPKDAALGVHLIDTDVQACGREIPVLRRQTCFWQHRADLERLVGRPGWTRAKDEWR